MLKKSLKIIIVLIICVSAGFVIGGRYGYRHCGVIVTLINASGQNIKSIRLTHERGISILEDLKKGRSKMIKFLPEGENSYSLDVEFENGKTIKGGAGYVEPGYKITETITEKDIKPEYRIYR